MNFLKNDSTFKDRRRELRRNQTDVEKVLWSKVRNKQLLALKFFRQYSVGAYILDFYCPAVKLAVELDGGQHNLPDGIAYDTERTAFLNAHGIAVVRYWNSDVLQNIDGVIEDLTKRLEANPSWPPLN